MRFHKNINKTFTRNTTINAKNLALDKNVQWTFLRSTKMSQKCIFQTFNRVVSLQHHLWCDIFKTNNRSFSNFIKTLKNQTPVIKRKMDILEIEKCPFLKYFGEFFFESERGK